MKRHWNSFFFAGGSAEEFHLFRALFYLGAIPYIVLHFQLNLWGFPESARDPFVLLGWLPSFTQREYLLQHIALASTAVGCAAGSGGRFVRAMYFFLCLWIFGDRYLYGISLNQVDSPLVICSFLMIFAPGRADAPKPGDFAWPLQFTRLFLSLVLLESALAKLRSSGIAWITADPLRIYLGFQSHSLLRDALLAQPALTRILSVAVFLFELSFPLAFLHRQLRYGYAVALLLFLISVRLLFGHPFVFSLLPLLAAFLPLEKLPKFRLPAFACILIFLPALANGEPEHSLIEKAKQEKTLNVAGNQMISNKVVIEAFRKKYPFLKVHVIDFEAINAKYRFFHLFESASEEERGDVVLRAQDKDTEDWIAHGWLAKLNELPLWSERTIKDEPSSYMAFYVGMAHGLVFNPKLIAEKDLPKSYDELLEPKWKKKIVIRSPLKGVSVATFASYIKETRGLDWFQRFGKNEPYVVQDYLDQHREVLLGHYPIALSRDLEVSSFALQLMQDRHRKSLLKFALMREEVPYQYMLAAVNSAAFHPAGARLFVNFLLSKEAEALLEAEGYSAGGRRKEQLARPKAWQWDMSKVKGSYEYNSYVARAFRELRDGGAKIQPVLRYGKPAIE